MPGQRLPSQAPIGDPRNGDDLVPGDDDRPRVAGVARHLRVDEEVLHLLPPTGEPVSGAARADDEPRSRALDPPRAEAHAALEADVVVLAHGTQPAAEVGGLRAVARREELGERPLEPSREPRALLGQREEVLLGARDGAVGGAGGSPCRMSPRFVLGVRGVDPVLEAVLLAVALRVLSPDLQQRPNDAVLALRLDALRAARGHEAVEDGLDLIGRSVACRAQASAFRQPVPDVSQRGLGRGRGKPRPYG